MKNPWAPRIAAILLYSQSLYQQFTDLIRHKGYIPSIDDFGAREK